MKYALMAKTIKLPSLNTTFVIAKVSPDMHAAVMSHGRLYIELSSYPVTDHFYPIQCFRCQNFGHLSSSPLCKAKVTIPEVLTCLYCSENHRSSTCPVKKNKREHKCANCLASRNVSIKTNAKSHTATSKLCPIFKKEVERLKEHTCYDQNVFIASKN